MKMDAVLEGVVLGRTIQLDQESGLPNGQKVRITISTIPPAEIAEVGDGLKRAFGAWADDSESIDDFLQWNRQQRKLGRAEIGP